MKARIFSVLLVLLCLTGCAPLLRREYSTIEPHSSKFWENEAVGTLRAENYQDIVNDLLILIGQHTEAATIRLYNYKDDVTVTTILEQAAMEVQRQTPLGAYAVEYITSSLQAQRGYYEISIQIGYRRTAEQIQAVVNATRPEAIYMLLSSALDDGKTELAVRISYWEEDGQEIVESAIVQLWQEKGLTGTPVWEVHYYPTARSVGLIEILLNAPEALRDIPSEIENAQ